MHFAFCDVNFSAKESTKDICDQIHFMKAKVYLPNFNFFQGNLNNSSAAAQYFLRCIGEIKIIKIIYNKLYIRIVSQHLG